MNNVTGIYALEPMTHFADRKQLPRMAALETIQQFALLNQIALPNESDGLTQFTGNSYPLNTSYAFNLPPPAKLLRRCYSATPARVSISTTRVATTKPS